MSRFKKFTLARVIEPYRRKYIGLGSEEELNNFLNPTASSAELADPNSDINTVDKYTGKGAYDTDADEPVWASGPDPSDPWEPATGTGGGSSGLPTGYLTGLVTAINGGSPLTDIDIGIGAARSSDDQEDIRLTSALTKELDNVWAAGSGAGGRASAASLNPDTWYHMFVITDGTDVDAGFDTSISAVNLLADSGYTQFRRIGSVLTDGSNDIVPYTQQGSRFLWDEEKFDFDGNGSTTETTTVLTVPIDVQVEAQITAELDYIAAAANIRVYSVGQDDVGIPVQSNRSLRVTSTSTFAYFRERIRTDTSAQILHRANSNDPQFFIKTHGWEDPRAEFQSGGTGQVSRATSSEYCPGYTYTFVDTDTWRITGINAANLFNVGRRLKFIDGGSTYFGTVTAVDFDVTSAGDTTIDMSMESGDVLTNTITEVCLVTGATAWSPITDDPFGGTPINAIATGAIGGVQYWVIVGDAGRLATSTDGGLNWTNRSSGVSGNFDDVAYNVDNETFVACARGGEISRSSNGTTWANPGDLTGIVTTGSGQCYVDWDPETSLWLVIIERLVNNFASYSAPDSASMTWTIREGGMGSNQRSLRYYGYTEFALEELVIAQNDDVVVLDNALDASSNQRYSNVLQQNTDIIGVFDPAADGGGGQDRYICLGSTGTIRALNANGSGDGVTDTVTFTARLNRAAVSPIHERIVVVGNDANLGYSQVDETEVFDSYTFVASGFGPLVNILCVGWNDSDGVFVAGAEDGTICRSSNGTN